MNSENSKRGPVMLLAGICVALMFIAATHLLSPLLPGPAGETFRNNVANDIEATALIYTESGDVHDYFDEESGKYYLKLGWK